MSHILEGKTSICFQILNADGTTNQTKLAQAYQALRASVELVASQYEPVVPYGQKGEKVSVADYIISYGGGIVRVYEPERQSTVKAKGGPIQLSLFAKGLERGVGFYIDPDSGNLTNIGDSWGNEALYKTLCDQITQAYAAMQLRRIMSSLGYSVTLADGEDSAVVVRGVMYA